MWHYVLFYDILYYFITHYTLLWHNVLFYDILFPFYDTVFNFMIYCTFSWHDVLLYDILYYFVTSYTVLWHNVLLYDILFDFITYCSVSWHYCMTYCTILWLTVLVYDIPYSFVTYCTIYTPVPLKLLILLLSVGHLQNCCPVGHIHCVLNSTTVYEIFNLLTYLQYSY